MLLIVFIGSVIIVCINISILVTNLIDGAPLLSVSCHSTSVCSPWRGSQVTPGTFQ